MYLFGGELKSSAGGSSPVKRYVLARSPILLRRKGILECPKRQFVTLTVRLGPDRGARKGNTLQYSSLGYRRSAS